MNALLQLLSSLPSLLVSILIEIRREEQRRGMTTEELFEEAGIRFEANEETASALLAELLAKLDTQKS
jgi:hypothetical protein